MGSLYHKRHWTGAMLLSPASGPAVRDPEGAALCTVATRQTRKVSPAAAVNLFLVSKSKDESVRSDLSRCVAVTALTSSDSLYGGGSPTESGLRLDLRASGHNGERGDSISYLVDVERCAGWPCHATYEAVVRRTPEGARVVSLKPLAIE
jgi:hypothetical protein